MSVLQIDMCCHNDKAYTVIFSSYNDEYNTTQKVCSTCFNLEVKSRYYPDTLIKQYQRNAIRIICIHCNQDVTKTRGCVACKTVSEEEVIS